MDSNHLLVNWENFLEDDCDQKYIKEFKIEVMVATNIQNDIQAPPSDKSAIVNANPCHQHIIIVKVLFTNDYISNFGRSMLQSPSIAYNAITMDNNFPNPFGGLLATEILPKVCLKKNGTIHIPRAPRALAECDVQSGDVEDPDFQLGTTANVKITFKHALQPNHNTYQMFEVRDIKACTGSQTINNNYSVMIGLIVGFSILLFALFILVVVACWKRQKKTNSKNIKKEVDVNPVYGIYALNEEGEDISVTEVRDTNDYYFK